MGVSQLVNAAIINRAAMRGSSALPIAALTATRLAPAFTTSAMLSRLIPPIANAGSDVSAAAFATNSTPESESNCLVNDENVGPMPM